MSVPQLHRMTRRQAAIDRDGPTCVWCAQRFTDPVGATTEHLVPRVKGGPSWVENEVAACRRCNRERGHLPVAEWFEECRRRGWDPDLARIVDHLESLGRAIAARGGQRRARPYLDHQLRRLRRISGPRPGL